MYSESGIYCYKNKKNGKLYIGQATNLKTRYVSFYNTNRRYAGKVIDNARKKYGVENFEYSILTHCPVDELNYWECFYVERLKTITPYGYNMTYGGDSSYTTTEYFINKQKEILIKTINKRNPKIITDNIIYKSHRTKVLLICPEHGEFWLTPDHILNKSTNKLLCPHCVKEFIRKKTETFFFKKAKEKWGNKYDYSKTLIKSRINHVTITCPIHGDFVVIPGNHISKGKNVGGCPKCSQIISHKAAMEKGEKKLLSIIKEKFGDKYSLEKFKYKGDKEKVTLICPIHGEFSMSPNNLKKSLGCPKCSGFFMDQEYFIEKSKKVHGEKYDYSKVQYKTVKIKVCIICPEHGEFYQSPSSHMEGNGCPKCGRLTQAINRTNTTEYFIKKAIEIHGNKYDYSKTEYVNYDTKVCIICPEHGEFWQKPSHHLIGLGCLQCSKTIKRKTTEQFINEAKKIHGDKYDYSKVNYINNHTKVCLVCSKHGDFWITPAAHLQKCGCKKCREENFKIKPNEKFINKVNELYPNKYTFEKCNYRNKNTFVTLFDTTINDYVSIEPDELIRKKPKTIELINILKEKFGDIYDYSKVEYIADKKPIYVICPKHGEFSMTYNNLINSKGCPQCTKENAFKNKKNGETNESAFITEAKKIHGDKYDYSKVIYKNSHAKICIVCPEHGEFYQTPNNHLSGYGCTKCGNKNHNVQKKILQYDLNGNFIKEWNNCQEIINSGIGKSETNIRKCCLGSQNVAYNFIWKYKETDVLIEKHILQLTKNNVLVKEWNSMSQIKKEKPINSTQHIFPCLNGKTKTAGGFIWKYKNN